MTVGTVITTANKHAAKTDNTKKRVKILAKHSHECIKRERRETHQDKKVRHARHECDEQVGYLSA